MVQRDGGVLVADAPSAATAERFTLRTRPVRDRPRGRRGARRRRRRARGRQRPPPAGPGDRGPPAPAAARVAGRAGARGAGGQPVDRPRRRLVLPVRARRARRRRRRRRVDRRTAGRSSGTAWPTCSAATPSRTGRLAQAWPETEQDAGDLLDYDVIGGGLTYWYAAAARPVGVRARPELHDRGLRGDRAVGRGGPGDRPEHAATGPSTSWSRSTRPPPSTGCRCRTAGSSRTGGSGWSPRRPRWSTSTSPPTRSPSGTSPGAGSSSSPGGTSCTRGRRRRTCRSWSSVDVDGEPVPPRTLDAWVRAIDHDEREDVTFAERTREAGDALEVTRGRRTGWVLFRDVDLTGVGHVELTVARGGSVRVEVRDGRGVAVARDGRRPRPEAGTTGRPSRSPCRSERRARRAPGPGRRDPARLAAGPAATVSR